MSENISDKNQTAHALRTLIRNKTFVGPTCGLAPGFVQANLAILPKALAFEFLLFCQRNPKPCPIIEVLEPGKHEPLLSASGADVRLDVPLYRVYRFGELQEEVDSLMSCWREDLVSFLLGCSFSFEHALMERGIALPYIEKGSNVPMFTTNIQTKPCGPFFGPMVVSQRWIPGERVSEVIQLTAQYPFAHGAPIHVGDARHIGIENPYEPDFGDPWVPEAQGYIPLYWACGVTPQMIALHCKTDLMITHAPGHMFVTDLSNQSLMQS